MDILGGGQFVNVACQSYFFLLLLSHLFGVEIEVLMNFKSPKQKQKQEPQNKTTANKQKQTKKNTNRQTIILFSQNVCNDLIRKKYQNGMRF